MPDRRLFIFYILYQHSFYPLTAEFCRFDPSDGNSSRTSSTVNPAAAAAAEPGPNSPNLIWRVLLNGRLNPDDLLINISTNQLLTEGAALFSSEAGPPDVELSSLDQEADLNDTLEFVLGHRSNESGDALYQNKTVQGDRRSTGRSNRTR